MPRILDAAPVTARSILLALTLPLLSGAGAARSAPDDPSAPPSAAPAAIPAATAPAARPGDDGDSARRQLADAEAALAARPDDPEAWIWKGRRLGYLGRFEEAVAVFSAGFERFPGDARFLRHRGHRLISLRRFAEAAVDLERAWRLEAGRPDAIEPDGLPNAANVPTSTTQGNIGYHWGLALYLQGRWREAAEAYRLTMAVAKHPDMEVATRYWWTLALRRAGDAAAAREAMRFRLDDGERLLESFAYDRLLAMMRGDDPEQTPEALVRDARRDRASLDFPTIAYGVAAHLALAGDAESSRALLDEILGHPRSAAFGYLAAEADRARDSPTSSHAPPR